MTPKEQMNVIEEFLSQEGIKYVRQNRFSDEQIDFMDFLNPSTEWGEQIIAYDDSGNRWWDIIYGFGAHGNEERPFEGMGRIFIPDNDDDEVEDYLTVEDVIKRIEDYLVPIYRED